METDGGDGFGYETYDPDARPAEVEVEGTRDGLPFLQQPSRWSCVPTAFAMVVSKDNPKGAKQMLNSIMTALGRDDERGFHEQELLGICSSLNHAFVKHEFKPEVALAACKDGTWRDGECTMEKQTTVEGDSDYFPCDTCHGSGFLEEAPLVLWPIASLMAVYDGVLVGTRKGATHLHAVAWCTKTRKVLDPEAGIYDLDGFDPVEFFVDYRILR